MSFYRFFRSLDMAVLLLMALPVSAEDSLAADKWEFDAAIYLWGASIYATPTGVYPFIL